MASASNLLDLSLEPEEDLVMGGDDLVDYYYKFIVGDSRVHRNFPVGSMTGREAKKLKACPRDIPDDCVAGDCSACKFAQTAHLAVRNQVWCFHFAAAPNTEGAGATG